MIQSRATPRFCAIVLSRKLRNKHPSSYESQHYKVNIQPLFGDYSKFACLVFTTQPQIRLLNSGWNNESVRPLSRSPSVLSPSFPHRRRLQAHSEEWPLALTGLSIQMLALPLRCVFHFLNIKNVMLFRLPRKYLGYPCRQ